MSVEITFSGEPTFTEVWVRNPDDPAMVARFSRKVWEQFIDAVGLDAFVYRNGWMTPDPELLETFQVPPINSRGDTMTEERSMDQRVAYWERDEVDRMPPTDVIREIARRRGCEPVVIVREIMVKAGITHAEAWQVFTTGVAREDLRPEWLAAAEAAVADGVARWAPVNGVTRLRWNYPEPR